ncbi:Hsp70 family protein [bacterium]|nr:Hsp70 family protein [bacterium]
MNDKMHKVIGIDLGTTYSAVAAYNTFMEKAEIIRNPESDNNPETTPSVASIEPMLRKVIVGSAAKRNLAVRPDETVIEIKREMGEIFSDEKALERFRAKGVFNVKDPVKVFFAGQWMLPQQISAFILMKMKEVAEREIGEEIHDAVVTVPAYFKEPQKKATEEAALLAGLYPRQIIPEPTAAAICYGVDRMETEKKTYLVYDLGGGTFDVSIIQVETGNLAVISTSGDPRLGGGDFDDAITAWAVDELRQQGIDISANPIALAKIKSNAEFTKIALSYNLSAKMVLEFIKPGATLELTREKFLSLIDPYLRKSLSYVDMAINNARTQKGVDRDQIDAILLVGGSSKIPKIKEMLLDSFGKDESFVRSELNPDAVVAQGAAILAKRFAPTEGAFNIKRSTESLKMNTDSVDDGQIRLITEHSLGIGVQESRCVRLIEQGSNIPIEVKRSEFTNPPNARKILVPVFQGEGKFVFENTPIGELVIDNIDPKPEGFHQFEVTFKLDVNGLLTMVVVHLNTGKPYEVKFDQKTGVGGDEALNQMRNKLLSMYAHGSTPIPQPSGGAAAPGSAPDFAPPPQPGSLPGSGQPSQAGGQPAPPPTPGAQAAPTPPPAPQAGQAATGMIEPACPVPEQFKSIVRRSQKSLIKGANPELLKAYNEFISALNAGKTGEPLEELGDTLEDVYADTKK